MTKELYEEKFCYLGVCDLPQLPFGLKGYEIQSGSYIYISKIKMLLIIYIYINHYLLKQDIFVLIYTPFLSNISTCILQIHVNWFVCYLLTIIY